MDSGASAPVADITSASPQLSIVIPAYNAIGQVEGLLRHLCALMEDPANRWEVILADDASPDGTAAAIGEGFPQLRVVAGAVNQGFGANVMRGAALARGDYLALLNTDIELCGNPFPALIDALRAEARLFAAMPLIFNTALDKVENLTRLYCRRGLCWHVDLPEAEQWTVELRAMLSGPPSAAARLGESNSGLAPLPSLLCGAAFVCRREAFMRLGGFDPRYRPFYWEDVDLGYRAARGGLHCATMPQALMLHRHSETINKHCGALKWRHLKINQLRFILAHRDRLSNAEAAAVLPKNLRPLPHEVLRRERFWWALRALREWCCGDKVLGAAYWAAARGRQE